MFDLLRFQRFSPRDRQGTGLEFFSEVVTSALVADATPSVNHTAVPRDRILIVASWTIVATPGASQSLTAVIFMQRRVSPLTDWYLEGAMPTYNQGTTQSYLSVKLNHIILNNTLPRALAAFNAGLNNNQVQSHLRGFLVPKGILPGAD